MIIATAGHVDHGKTSLVKALTGIDTDRLPEEKRRGMSIDLGFAFTTAANGAALAFIDVPGHEKFVRNMIAGVTGVQLALIVVAADDGPMPQTLEHIQILHLLGIRIAVVAITKTDLVPEQRIDAVKKEIDALLRNFDMDGAPVFPVSVRTGAGIDSLRGHLANAAGRPEVAMTGGPLRINVDRAFSLKGIGLVVTGTVVTGEVRIGDEVILMPANQAARVRSVHANNLEQGSARQGQRCAINLSGLSLDTGKIGRGQVVLARGDVDTSMAADVEVSLCSTSWSEKKIPASFPVNVFAGTQSLTGTLHRLDKQQTPETGPFLARLALKEAAVLFSGDRILLRESGSGRLIGGAVVVDPLPPARGRSEPERLAWLTRVRPDSAAETLANLLQTGSGFVDLDWLSRAFHLTQADCETILGRTGPLRRLNAGAFGSLSASRSASLPASLPVSGPASVAATDSTALRAATGRLVLTSVHWDQFLDKVTEHIARHHAEHPESVGIKPAELSRSFRNNEQVALPEAVAELLAMARLARCRAGLRRPGHRPVLSSEDAALLRKVRPLLAGSGLRPPRLVELAETLGLERPALEASLIRIARSEAIFQVAKNRFYLPETLSDLAKLAETLAAEHPEGRFDAARYRDISALGRNLTIQVLEYFDAVGLCWRDGEARKFLKPASNFFEPPQYIQPYESINGRDTFPVERAGFKPVGGCIPSLGSSTLSSSAKQESENIP